MEHNNDQPFVFVIVSDILKPLTIYLMSGRKFLVSWSRIVHVILVEIQESR